MRRERCATAQSRYYYSCEARFLLTPPVGAHCARPPPSPSVDSSVSHAQSSAISTAPESIVIDCAAQKPLALPPNEAGFPPSATVFAGTVSVIRSCRGIQCTRTQERQLAGAGAQDGRRLCPQRTRFDVRAFIVATSAVRLDRRRRSCATIVSCHVISCARSDSASVLPISEDTIAYGFMLRPFLSRGIHAHFNRMLLSLAVTRLSLLSSRCIRTFFKRVCVVQDDPAFDVIPIGPMEAARARSPYEQSAGRAVWVPRNISPNTSDRQDVDRCDSRLRHRPEGGWCRTRGLRKTT